MYYMILINNKFLFRFFSKTFSAAEDFFNHMRGVQRFEIYHESEQDTESYQKATAGAERIRFSDFERLSDWYSEKTELLYQAQQRRSEIEYENSLGIDSPESAAYRLRGALADIEDAQQARARAEERLGIQR